MPYLKYISDAQLELIIGDILEKGRQAVNRAHSDFYKNVVDPFGMLFEMACFEQGYERWIALEKQRKAQKSLSNNFGILHQRVLGSVDGWTDVDDVVDVVNDSMKIVAEVKNKHNTVKGSDLKGVYETLSDLVTHKHSRYKDYTAYYVQIIPKNCKRFDQPFTPSDNTKGNRKPADPKLREIDGVSFYHLVTGRKTALLELFEVLPKVINKLSDNGMQVNDELLEQFRRALPP